MTETAFPPHEAERLAALYPYEILDPQPEEPLDNLVHLAAHICQAPIALICLIDSDRQWLKAKIGLTDEQTARIIAFCRHNILTEELLVVPDTLADERFATFPLLADGPRIRFYSGVPLKTHEGCRIGMLSVIDVVPHELSQEQVEAMRVLSRQVMDHLTLARWYRELLTTERVLRPTQDRMGAILENSRLMVFVKDLQGRYVLTNREFDQRFGFPPGHAVGKTDSDLFDAEEAAIFQANDQEVLRTGVPTQFEETVRYTDGRHTNLVVKFPLRGPLNDMYAIGGVVMDITKRKGTEQALRESEERFRLVAEVTNDVLWDWDLVTNEHWWSPNARDKFGYDPAKEPTIQAWSARLHPEDRQRVLSDVSETIKSGKRVYAGEYRFRLADGSYGFFVDKGQVVYDAQDKPVRMIGAMIDMTAAKRAYLSLKEAYERLKSMSRELQMAEENERRRLSRELHDEFGQLLSALRLNLARASEGIARRLDLKGSVLEKQVLNASKAVDRLFVSLREMIHGLRPAVLEELGLVAALQAVADDLQENAGIQCHVSTDREDFGSLLGVQLEGTLYRIAQELLTNVVKHAHATRVRVSLVCAEGKVFLTIQDNGRGIRSKRTKGGFGLRNVRERAELLGGGTDIDSGKGRGTSVTVTIPIESPAQGFGAWPRAAVKLRKQQRRRHAPKVQLSNRR